MELIGADWNFVCEECVKCQCPDIQWRPCRADTSGVNLRPYACVLLLHLFVSPSPVSAAESCRSASELAKKFADQDQVLAKASSLQQSLPPALPKGAAASKKVEDAWLVLQDSPEDIFRMGPLTSGATRHERNLSTLREMEGPIAKPAGAGRIVEADRDLALRLYQQTSQNPVADLCQIDKYDPNGQIGFCFGRATAAHLEALAQGIDKSSVRKMFIHGTLESGDTQWRYHVTTIVKAKDGGWWALDPIMGRPMKAEEWYQSMHRQYNPSNDARIVITPASRFSCNGGKYQRGSRAMDHPGLNDYFKDLLKTFREREPSPAKVREFEDLFRMNSEQRLTMLSETLEVPMDQLTRERRIAVLQAHKQLGRLRDGAGERVGLHLDAGNQFRLVAEEGHVNEARNILLKGGFTEDEARALLAHPAIYPMHK